MFEKIELPASLKPSDPRFGAGPSLVPVSYLKSLEKTGMELLGTSHRQKAVKNLVKEVQEGLTQYFNLPSGHEVLLGNGGATLLFDMIGLGLVEKHSEHFTCGEFSQKWFKSHKNIPWIEATEHSAEMGQGISPKVGPADLLACTLNETSTGVIIDKWPDKQDHTLITVDATSGGGQVPCPIEKTDLYFFSPQKVFASEGGLWVALASPRAIERALKLAQDKSRYVPGIMDWKSAIDNSRKNQTYNTPSISTLFFLNEQIKRMNQLGYEKIQNLGNERAEKVYAWAEEKPYLSPFIKEKQFRSNVVATIDVDEKLSVKDLTSKLREMGWVYDIDSYRKLGRNQFRIGLFHNVSMEDTEKLIQLLSLALESQL